MDWVIIVVCLIVGFVGGHLLGDKILWKISEGLGKAKKEVDEEINK